jgi:phosphoribosylglycinamide formyltransferase 1
MNKLVVLISGRGSNMLSIARACQSGRLNAQVIHVIGDRDPCEGLISAQAMNLSTSLLPYRSFESRAAFDDALLKQVDALKPDWVVLAGFMRILTPAFVNHFLGRLVNIHPSLLPSFPGLHTHRQALQAKVSEHGATVHFVTPELDHGPTILQAKVPVLNDDDEASLGQRVLGIEHELYIQSLSLLIEKKVNFKTQTNAQTAVQSDAQAQGKLC